MRVLECGTHYDRLCDSRIICSHVRCYCIVWLELSPSSVVGADSLCVADVPAMGIKAKFIEKPKSRLCLEGSTGVGCIKAFYWVGEGIV